MTAAFDFVAFMDSDGQHSASDLVRLLAEAYASKCVVFGVRDESYRRGFGARVGVKILDFLKLALGSSSKSQLSEFLVVPHAYIPQLKHHPSLGVIPLATVLVSLGLKFETSIVHVEQRLGEKKTNFNGRALFRKALYEIFSEPWAFLPRVFAIVCLLSLIFSGYAIFIGVKQSVAQAQNGVASIILLQVVFSLVNSLLLLVVLGVLTLHTQSQQRLSIRHSAIEHKDDVE